MSDVPLVALVGNPNTGKTTVFNALTGSRAKVGNYPGVTIERRVGKTVVPGRGEIELVDIPGSYSLLARTGEEQIAFDAVLGLHRSPRPQLAVVCLDATQLARSAYLLLQIQEMGVPVVVALTMTDEARDAAPSIDALSAVLECPVVAVVARIGKGLDTLREAIGAALDAPPARPIIRWEPSTELAAAIAKVRAVLPAQWPQHDGIALWALQSIEPDDELLGIPPELRRAVLAIETSPEIAARFDDEVTRARYQWLDAHVGPLVTQPPDRSATERVDKVLLHRVGGFAIFVAIMFVVFQALFSWSDPLIGVIEQVFGWVGETIAGWLPAGILADFIVDGVIAGVGSVIVFLPQILLLFFFIGLMEDSGYMARVAYLMDRVMRSMNLHGKAFVPMISGFACAVPAILATRTMERRRDRLLTMMVVPLMTCSARLPVYTLIIGALFPVGRAMGLFPIQGLLMVGMYAFSVVMSLAAAWVLSKTVAPLKGKRLPFVIELPPYRLPRFFDVTRMMWERTAMFLREAGTVILVCTIILWALVSFPRHLPAGSPDYDAAIAQAEQAADQAEVSHLEQEKAGALLRNSYGGRLGKLIEPTIAPLGFDWKIGVGLIGAFAAREVFVSTLGVVYSVGDDFDSDESLGTLRARIKAETRDDGTTLYSPLVGLVLMIFFALACQCMSTLAVVKRETGGYRWPLFLFGYMTALAWTVSFLVYQGGRLLGF